MDTNDKENTNNDEQIFQYPTKMYIHLVLFT